MKGSLMILGLSVAMSSMVSASETEDGGQDIFDRLDYGFWIDWSSRHTSRGRDYLDGSGAFSQGVYVGAGNFGFELDRSGAMEDGTKELNFDLYYYREFEQFSVYGAYEYSDWNSSEIQVGGSSLSFGATYFELPAGLWISGDVEYSLDRDGFFSELSIGSDIEAYDWLTLTPALSVGFNSGYVEDGHDGLNHAVASLSADFFLTDQLQLTASAAYNWAINRETDFVRYPDDAILGDFFWTGLTVSVGKGEEGTSPRWRDWRLALGTSVWATAWDGSLSMGGGSLGVGVVDDSYEQVHTGLSVGASRGPWSVLVDGSYVSFGAEVPAPLPIFAPEPVEVRMADLRLGVGYRVLDRESARVDVFAGARYQHLETESKFSVENRRLDWADPTVGIRARMMLLEKLELSGRADFGGFGLGSDQYWQVDVGLGYELTNDLSVQLRYQHLEVDYTRGDRDVEFTFKGPKIGASYRF